MFLGSDNSTSPSPVNDKLITLTGNCTQREGVPYESVCTITVSAATSSEAAGFYQVTLTNTAGEEHLLFQVQYTGFFLFNLLMNMCVCVFALDVRSFILTNCGVIFFTDIKKKQWRMDTVNQN
jgi:hypothetical protein